jgi:predicted CoA-binding protein
VSELEIGIDALGQRIAMVGISASTSDFSHTLMRALEARGCEVIPVRPGVTTIEGHAAYASLLEIPGPIEGVVVTTPPRIAERVVADCHRIGVRLVWLDPAGVLGTSDDAIAFCRTHQIDVMWGSAYLKPLALPRGVAPPSRMRSGSWAKGTNTGFEPKR